MVIRKASRGCRRQELPAGERVNIEQLLRENRTEIQRIAAKHGAYNVRVFGSVARGDAGPSSDVDLLVEAGSVTSSWFPAGLILDLEDLLRSEEHTSELQSRGHLVCRLLLEK